MSEKLRKAGNAKTNKNNVRHGTCKKNTAARELKDVDRKKGIE